MHCLIFLTIFALFKANFYLMNMGTEKNILLHVFGRYCIIKKVRDRLKW